MKVNFWLFCILGLLVICLVEYSVADDDDDFYEDEEEDYGQDEQDYYDYDYTESEANNPNDDILFRPVIGGNVVTDRNYNWMASIQTWYGAHFCGGVLISPWFVLTAAYCVDDYEPEKIVFGQYRLYTHPEEGSQVRYTARIYIHLEYEDDDYTKFNDIALIKLNKPVYSISPIPWTTDNEAPILEQNGRELSVLGWGSTSREHNFHSIKLHKAELEVISNSRCTAHNWYDDDLISDSHLCAGDDQHFEKDACHGDYGGPLIYTDNHGNQMIVGIVTYATNPDDEHSNSDFLTCGQNNRPGVFTRVSKFDLWIAAFIYGTTSRPTMFPTLRPTTPSPTSRPSSELLDYEDWLLAYQYCQQKDSRPQCGGICHWVANECVPLANTRIPPTPFPTTSPPTTFPTFFDASPRPTRSNNPTSRPTGDRRI